VDGRECQGIKGVEVVSFDRDAQRDERKVDNTATRLTGWARARAAYLEMCEVDET
jgi:hypothetical protein